MARPKIPSFIVTSARVARVTLAMLAYYFRREVGHKSWYAMLNLHCTTNGASTKILRRLIQKWKAPPAIIKPFDSLFGHFDVLRVNTIAEQIQRDGYYPFPGLVPAEICDQIIADVHATKGWLWQDGEHVRTVEHFESDNEPKARYALPESKVWQIPGYQRIVADPLFINLSQAYFGATPALKELNLWWSPAKPGHKPDTDAAQLFHFDYDAAPIWLKFFVYLNDVTSDTGPHVFARGSHRLGQEKARAMISRGYVRISDEEIANIYGADNIVEMIGPKGSVFAVDTMGFHKGKVPVAGHRLLAQIEFATPLFVPAASRPLPMPANAGDNLLATRNAYPWAFERFPVSP